MRDIISEPWEKLASQILNQPLAYAKEIALILSSLKAPLLNLKSVNTYQTNI